MGRRIVVGLATLAAVGLMSTPAAASCAELPSTEEAIEEARTVFVGTVVDAENLRRWVQVEVGDVWKGQPGARVEVRAGPPDPPGPMQVASSGDRHYKLGETYLFVLWGRTSPFRDDSCSATTVWGPRLAQYDPTPDEPESEPGLLGSQSPGPDEDGVTPEAILRWGVVAFSILVFVLAMTRNIKD